MKTMKSYYVPARRGLSPTDGAKTDAAAAALERYPARVRGQDSILKTRHS
jgi:hypothetical protein